MKSLVLTVTAFCLCLSFSAAIAAEKPQVDLTGFTSLFDGQTLDGWHKLTSYNEHGQWEVRDGAIAGDQFPEGEGGLLVTDGEYGDFEVYAEVKTTYPQDSGLFLRVQPNVLSYQVTIDHRPEGTIGALYVPGGGGMIAACDTGFTYWNPYDFNVVRARIEGQPPRIQVWINEYPANDYTDVMVEGKERVPAKGVLGIQVHPGENWKKGSKVLFRKIMIKELK